MTITQTRGGAARSVAISSKEQADGNVSAFVMPHVNVRGVDLFYEAYGFGTPLLIAHGLLGSVATAAQRGLRAEDIAAHGFHVVAYDARGHGRSGYSTLRSDYRWANLAEDMRALLDALGWERASVFGSSMGAGCALLLALAHPERVDRLILRSPPPFDLDLEPARRKLGALAALYRYLGVPLTAALVRAFSRGADASLPALVRNQRRAAVVPAIRGLLFEEPQLPLDELARITAPALVLAHPDDVLHPVRSAQRLGERLSHSEIVVLPSAAHFHEHPEELTRRVVSFLKQSNPASSPR